MTGSLETFGSLDLLGFLATRDGELDLSAIYGGQQVALRVDGGVLKAVTLNGHPWYDRTAIGGLSASLAVLRRGQFRLLPSNRAPTDRALGVALVPWLLDGVEKVALAAEQPVTDLDLDVRLRFNHPVLERRRVGPMLKAFLALAGYGLRDQPSVRTLAAMLGIDPAWTLAQCAELERAGVLMRVSAITEIAVRGATQVL
jgi:hypothetical protein